MCSNFINNLPQCCQDEVKEKDIDAVYWKDTFMVTIKLEEMLCLKYYKNISSGRNIGRIFINDLSD